MRRSLVPMLAIALIPTSLSVAHEGLAKKQIINRSAPICRDLLDAIEPHIKRVDDARAKEQWDRFIREGRRAIRSARPYGRKLRHLLPETGERTYGRFLDHGRAALDSLERGLDALEAERIELAKRRQQRAQDRFRRAKRAAKRYGLRPSCIRVVS